MPIEIKILNKRSSGDAPAGNYIARYLNDKNRTIQSLNPCRSVQIIEGIHSGQIVPYESYVVIGDLPAQADVLRQNVKMIEGLAEAARTIQEQDKVINRVKEESEKLRNGEYAINLAPHIGALKERNQQLEWEIEALRKGKTVELPKEVADEIDKLLDDCISKSAIAYRFFGEKGNLSRHGLSNSAAWAEYGNTDRGKHRVMLFLGALVNGYTVAPEPQNDEAADLLAGVTAIVQKWWFEAPDGRTAKSHSDRLANDICDYIKQREDDKLPF
ncbi:hypothetical protein D3C75_484490 [compost metagenome]